MNNDIIELFDKLKFKGMAAIYAKLLAKAERNGWSHQDLLLQLLQEELICRRERSTQYRLSQAR